MNPALRCVQVKLTSGRPRWCVVLHEKTILGKLSIYMPQSKIDRGRIERSIKLGKKKDRSVNYLVVEAIAQQLEGEEDVQ